MKLQQVSVEAEFREICNAYRAAETDRTAWGIKLGQKAYEVQNQQLTESGAPGKLLILKIIDESGIPRRTLNKWVQRYRRENGLDAPTPHAASARVHERETAAQNLEQENLFPAFDTKIEPVVLGDAPDGIGFDITFKNLKGAEAVRQLSHMPLEVPEGVQRLVEINKAHFVAVFGNLPGLAFKERITKLVELLNKEFGEGASCS